MVVHITYLPFISVLIFAILLEIFMHVVGKKVFLLFIAVKIQWQSFYKNKKSLATCVRKKFSCDHLGVR